MSASDASALIAAVKWSDESLSLQEFVHKIPLPQIAKIIKGQFKSLGVPTLPNPSLNQIVFLSSVGKRVKVVAQCVKFKEGRRVVPVGPILAIPEKFDGWFEILSEDGRAMRSIESVAELVKRFPDTCIVRENIKAFVPNTNTDSGKITDKTRVIHAGETLVLVSEVSGNHFQKTKTSNGQNTNKFLRCFDVNGESVYFSLEQSGKFSPVAGEENISGVHTIKNLLRKRMPITVKMVHGKMPNGVLKSCYNQGSPEMRLLGVVEEECMVAMPMLKDFSNIVTVPMCAGLKLQAPRNNDELRKLREYARLAEKCKWLGRDNADKIHVLDMSSKSKEVIHIKNSYSRYGGHSNIHQYFGNIHNQIKKFNCDGGKAKVANQKRNSHAEEQKNSVQSPKSDSNKDLSDSRYDEIDVIYDYVRGFGPLPKSISKEFEKMGDSVPKKIPHNPKPVKQVKSVQTNQQITVSTPKSPKITVNKAVPLEKPSEGAGRKKSTHTEGENCGASSPTAKTASLPTKKPPVEVQKKVEIVKEDDNPPEPPPIETIPVRRSVSMPNATANNIVVMNTESTSSPPPRKSSVPQKTAPPKNSQKEAPTNQINMTDNVAYSNFVPQAKDNVYDKITHEHEPFTIDLKSPNIISRIRQKKDTITTNKNSSCNNKSNNKIFIKSHSPNKSQRPRIFKHSFSSPAAGDEKVVHAAPPHYRRQSKTPKTKTAKVNPTPSPIFNLRYKSLTDLALDFDTLDSSNSGGQISDGSGGSGPNDLIYIRSDKCVKDDGHRRLPRPKSLTNLVWPANEADCINTNNNCGSVKQYNNIMSNFFHNNINNSSSKKCGNSRKLSDGVLIYGRNGGSTNQAQKRLSALYL